MKHILEHYILFLIFRFTACGSPIVFSPQSHVGNITDNSNNNNNCYPIDYRDDEGARHPFEWYIPRYAPNENDCHGGEKSVIRIHDPMQLAIG